MRLQDKSVVITGAGSGVGRASALLFASEGARVVCADIESDWANETQRMVEQQQGTAVAIGCNVASETDVVSCIRKAVDAFGRLDVMFNNAGVSTPPDAGSFEDYTDDQWDRLMNINVRGVFYGMKHAIRQFKSQGDGGVIVNTGSAAGMVGWGGTVYGTSKGAVIQMTRAVAVEAAPAGIRVNAIAPGGMVTNFGVHDPAKQFQVRPDMAEMIGSLHPLGRPVAAEDSAAAALFLASDEARNVTGVILPVDGGYLAK